MGHREVDLNTSISKEGSLEVQAPTWHQGEHVGKGPAHPEEKVELGAGDDNEEDPDSLPESFSGLQANCPESQHIRRCEKQSHWEASVWMDDDTVERGLRKSCR